MPDSIPTTIQALAILRSQAMDRNEALDLVEAKAAWKDGANIASRSWSRQEMALADAMVAEPPRDMADVLSVLLVSLDRIEEDLIMGDDAPPRGPAAKAAEQAWIATANCVLVLADASPPATRYEQADLKRIEKLRDMWLPGTLHQIAEGEAA